MADNKLYYGVNLEVLPRYVKAESVDLIYLDPPFNSRQDYNVLFAEKSGEQSASQIMAFEDTWEWNQESARTFEQVVEGGGAVAQAMIAFRTFLGASDMMAYLAMMAPRLIELHKGAKRNRVDLLALRSDRKPLLEDADGRHFRRPEFLERGGLEANHHKERLCAGGDELAQDSRCLALLRKEFPGRNFQPALYRPRRRLHPNPLSLARRERSALSTRQPNRAGSRDEGASHLRIHGCHTILAVQQDENGGPSC
jgi:hypothetical protein